MENNVHGAAAIEGGDKASLPSWQAAEESPALLTREQERARPRLGVDESELPTPEGLISEVGSLVFPRRDAH